MSFIDKTVNELKLNAFNYWIPIKIITKNQDYGKYNCDNY